MGLAAPSLLGFNAVLYYLLAYVITNLGVFAVVISVGSSVPSYEIESYRGLSRRAPFLAACMVVFLLSLAGIPPLAGFFAKFYVFSAVVEKRYFFMAAAAAVNSAIAAYYYLRIIRLMYFVPPDESTPVTVCAGTRAVIYILLTATFVLGLMPEPFIFYFRSILPF